MSKKNGDTKARIMAATRQLLLEVGYESMSPAKVLARSGAGQGSLYHHFSNKKALALAVLDELADELCADMRSLFERDDLSGLEKIDHYLAKNRKGLQGCKLGRLSNEKAFEEAELGAPLKRYFTFAHQTIYQALIDAADQGQIMQDHVEMITCAIMAVVQGGYVLSKASGEAEKVNCATAGVRYLLAMCAAGAT